MKVINRASYERGDVERSWRLSEDMLILLCLNVYTGHPKVPKGKTLTKLQKILGWESWACA